MMTLNVGSRRAFFSVRARWGRFDAEGNAIWTQRGVSMGVIRNGFLGVESVWIFRIPLPRRIYL